MVKNKDSVFNVLFVAFLVCIVASIAVSLTVEALKPIQDVNKQAYKQVNILKVAGIYQAKTPIASQFDVIESKLVNLDTGEYVDGDLENYDLSKIFKDPDSYITLTRQEDIASIKRRENVATVYLVKSEMDASEITKVILPIRGYGLWSTLYGFLAIDLKTKNVAGISFYQHKETAGLGGKVDLQSWKDSWVGKEIYGSNNEIILTVIKGRAVGEAKAYSVDGLSGASLTTRGVDNLIHFWLGDLGFDKYLKNLFKETEFS